MDLSRAMMISAAGMKAQSVRMRVISENMANADTVPSQPGEQPYQRKVVSFANVLNRAQGVNEVKVTRVGVDRADFGKSYQPGHPGADAEGYVRTPNVNSLVEIMDMRQAQRSYEANINSIEASRNMVMRTIDLLR